MNREDGLRALTDRGWLSTRPAVFTQALLADSRWFHVEAGEPIQMGDEERGEMIGLASGIIDCTTVLGTTDTPMMHFEHPVSWFGYLPILAAQPRRIRMVARSRVWLAGVSHARVRRLLDENPAWWQHLLPLPILFGNACATVAADLLIRDNERRCAAVLLRLAGLRRERPGDTAPAEIALSQDELAAVCALSRNTTGTVLRKLSRRGLIELGYRDIVVPSPVALRSFVDQV